MTRVVDRTCEKCRASFSTGELSPQTKCRVCVKSARDEELQAIHKEVLGRISDRSDWITIETCLQRDILTGKVSLEPQRRYEAVDRELAYWRLFREYAKKTVIVGSRTDWPTR